MEKYDLRVLYVEDEINTATDLQDILLQKVDKVYLAHDGQEGLELYFDKLPDLIITDIKMPKLSGLDMISEIRKVDHTIPVIVLSAFNNFEYLKESILLNITNYIVKPIDIDELFQAIDNIHEIVLIRKQNDILLDNIKKEKEKYKQLTLLSSEAIYILDTDGILVEYSETTKKQLGYDEEEMFGLHFKDINKDFSQEKFKQIISCKKNIIYEFETQNIKKDGTLFDVSIRAIKITIAGVDYVYAVARDISEYKKLNNKLHKLLDTQENMVVLTDGVNLEYANQRFLEFFHTEDLVDFEKNHGLLSDKFIQNDRYFHVGKLKSNSSWIDTIKNLPKEQRIVALLDGRYNVHIYSINITDFSDNSYLINLNDISSSMIKTLELEDKVIHDKLTGAYNREFFDTHIYTILTSPAYENIFTAVSYVDIDHFKYINDTYGHNIGDIVLKELVQLIKDFSRVDDILIRFGGEEFLLILQVKSLDSARRALEHFRHVIEFHKFKQLKQQVTCSFGVTLYREKENIKDTLQRADKALYMAKNKGRNKVIAME